MWFPFNFAKNLKDHHFLVGGSKNMKLSPNTCFGVSFQKNVLSSQIFRNNKPLPKYLTDRKLKMSVVFIFKIKGAKKDKIFNFLKDCFSGMGGPMNVIFSVFSETCVRLLKCTTFFSRYSKSYNNLNVKSCLKHNGP